MKWTGPDGFEADDSAERIDVDVVQGFLSTSYWAEGIPREVVERAVAGSLNLGVYDADGAMVAYARMVTDRATFAWLADVFVLEEYRGRGLSKLLMSTILDHPDLQALRRFALATKDAQGLYAQFGFTPLEDPSRFMVRRNPAVHRGGRYVLPADDGEAL